MPQPPRIPFHFHAHAQALGGEFRHPLWSIIPTQATASLPTVGGHATAEATDFHFQDFIHIRHAHTHISGKRRQARNPDGSCKVDRAGKEIIEFVTHSSTTLTGLNILGRLTFDRIVSRLSSIHVNGNPEGHITADDSRFEGFRIDGQEFEVKLQHDLLVKSQTFAELARTLASNPKFGKIDAKRQVASCTLIDTIATKKKLPGVTVQGNLITIDNFGKIFLAEVFAEVGTRTLTMLHLELGSPHVASIAAGESVTNGQSGPP